MINEIKRIIENYLSNIKLTTIVIGTVVDSGIKLNDKLTIPLSFATGNLKKYITTGDKLRLLRNLGGQEFLILEIIDRNVILENSKIEINRVTFREGDFIEDISIKEVI